jgi:hypothetical protein
MAGGGIGLRYGVRQAAVVWRTVIEQRDRSRKFAPQLARVRELLLSTKFGPPVIPKSGPPLWLTNVRS